MSDITNTVVMIAVTILVAALLFPVGMAVYEPVTDQTFNEDYSLSDEGDTVSFGEYDDSLTLELVDVPDDGEAEYTVDSEAGDESFTLNDSESYTAFEGTDSETRITQDTSDSADVEANGEYTYLGESEHEDLLETLPTIGIVAMLLSFIAIAIRQL